LAPVLPAETFEHCKPVLIAGDGLAVDQAGANPELMHGLDDGGIAVRPVVPVAGEQPDPGGIATHHHAEAIVLDFVDPVRPAPAAQDGSRHAADHDAGRKALAAARS